MKYKEFISEGIFSKTKKKTFEDKIEEIDDLIFSALKYRGLILTQSKVEFNKDIRILQNNKFIRILKNATFLFKDILVEYGRKMEQKDIDLYLDKYKSLLKSFRITFPGRLIDDLIEIAGNLNAIIQIMDHLKSTKNLNIDYKTVDENGNIDFIGIDKWGSQMYLNRQSMIDKKDKELRDKHKDIDPLGEEIWED